MKHGKQTNEQTSTNKQNIGNEQNIETKTNQTDKHTNIKPGKPNKHICTNKNKHKLFNANKTNKRTNNGKRIKSCKTNNK